ncbi:MAG: LptF/LptG family permease [Bacteroidota bacterium]
MTKIDWYILKKFLTSFFFTVLLFTMIVVMIDFSSKVENFVESEISRSEILLQYIPNFTLFMYGLLFPLFTLIAVVFFTSRLANNSEVLSIFNAGVSFGRFLRPYWVGAIFIAILHTISINYLVPEGTKTRLYLERVYFGKDKDEGKQRNIHLFINEDTKAYINFWRSRDSSIRGFRLERMQDHELVELLKAASAKYQAEEGKWRLSNYEMRTFNGPEETLVIGKGDQLDTLIDLHPSDFIDYKDQQASMTTGELLTYIGKQKRRGAGNTAKYEAELWRRSAEPISVLILTLIGVAVAARKVRGGMGMHLAIGILLGALFLIFSRFAIVFAAESALPALLSIWLPNLLFGSVAAYLLFVAQR